jgi:hypothetical protein
VLFDCLRAQPVHAASRTETSASFTRALIILLAELR